MNKTVNLVLSDYDFDVLVAHLQYGANNTKGAYSDALNRILDQIAGVCSCDHHGDHAGCRAECHE